MIADLNLIKTTTDYHEPKKLLQILIGILFLVSLSFGTFTQYAKTKDHQVISPENILAGESQAPNQYRILFPLVYGCVKKAVKNAILADKTVIFASILFCYVICGILFFTDTRSQTMSMICLLALYGAFASGFVWKYRQEFLETAFVTAAVVLIEKDRPNWIVFCSLTLFATLNRETWIFTIFATYIVRRSRAANPETWLHLTKQDLVGIVIAVLVYGTCFTATRMYFGLSEYHSALWMYKANFFVPFLPFYQPMAFSCSIWGIGSGLVLLYVITLLGGNRCHAKFIIGYCVPLLAVSFFIADWTEHRIFYSAYPMMLSASAKYLMQSPTIEQTS